jgi:hypothetical protein
MDAILKGSYYPEMRGGGQKDGIVGIGFLFLFKFFPILEKNVIPFPLSPAKFRQCPDK